MAGGRRGGGGGGGSWARATDHRGANRSAAEPTGFRLPALDGSDDFSEPAMSRGARARGGNTGVRSASSKSGHGKSGHGKQGSTADPLLPDSLIDGLAGGGFGGAGAGDWKNELDEPAKEVRTVTGGADLCAGSFTSVHNCALSIGGCRPPGPDSLTMIHSAASPSAFRRRFNRDGEGVSAK